MNDALEADDRKESTGYCCGGNCDENYGSKKGSGAATRLSFKEDVSNFGSHCRMD